MKKKKVKGYRCPACRQYRYQSELSIALKILQGYYRVTMPSYYSSFKNEIIESFTNEDMDWACDDCFQQKRAIPAVPSAIFDGGEPHLAHYDTALTCERCAVDFTFSKSEKKFWFEGLKFHADARPKNCVACRKLVRAEKKDNSRLSELLSQTEVLTKSEYAEIAAIYDRMGKEEKKRMYENLVRKHS
ncbi:MAG: zinc-ribbon domain containing protein [Saprospiraceae bacterium]